MSIGSRIKKRREELGLTQPQLAQIVSVSKGTIGNYESGVSSPNENILFRLFDALHCDANYLYQDDICIDHIESFTYAEKNHIKKYRLLDDYGKKAIDSLLNIEYDRCVCVGVDSYSKTTITINRSNLPVSAGSGALLSDENLEPREYPDTTVSRQADIVIPVSGDSMEPMFYDGDEIYVRLQPAVEIGEIGVFIVDNNGYVKEYGGNVLISINPKYPNIKLNDYNDMRCVGKVIDKVL